MSYLIYHYYCVFWGILAPLSKICSSRAIAIAFCQIFFFVNVVSFKAAVLMINTLIMVLSQCCTCIVSGKECQINLSIYPLQTKVEGYVGVTGALVNWPVSKAYGGGTSKVCVTCTSRLTHGILLLHHLSVLHTSLSWPA